MEASGASGLVLIHILFARVIGVGEGEFIRQAA